jgi:hypothetical protein
VRSLLSVLAGSLVAIVLYLGGAAAALLVMRGIPLGSAGSPPTPTEIAVQLALAATASLFGAWLAIRLSSAPSRLQAGAVGLLLGIGAIAGFGKPASQWPAWFGVAIAIACFAGAMSAAAWTIRRQ